MRGKGAEGGTNLRNIRITPAYAGKSDAQHHEFLQTEDHPRLCGEKKRPLVRAYSILGSPPPMRGKDSFPLLEALALGITPAYAGKSIGDALMGLELEDHPRLCGEKLEN